MRGMLAEVLRCRIEVTEDREEAHRRLDKLLDTIEGLEHTAPYSLHAGSELRWPPSSASTLN